MVVATIAYCLLLRLYSEQELVMIVCAHLCCEESGGCWGVYISNEKSNVDSGSNRTWCSEFSTTENECTLT